MRPERAIAENIVFSPNLRADDELANYWMRQAMLRARREIAWIWHERGLDPETRSGELPPVVDKASDSLDLSRHWTAKRQFFDEDVAAHYLTEKLAEEPPAVNEVRRGSFSWVQRELALDEVSSFALGLGLATSFDASFGAVIASCLNDHSRTYPNLMLVQRLWDVPEQVLELSDPMHPLFSLGLLTRSSSARRHYAETMWEQPFTVPSLVARELLATKKVAPSGLALIESKKQEKGELDRATELIAHRLRSENASRLRIVPLLGNSRSGCRQSAIEISRITGRALWEYCGDPALLGDPDYLNMITALCWLQGRDLLIGVTVFDERQRERNEGLPLVSIPATLFIAITERKHTKHIDRDLLLPVVRIPSLGYEQRLSVWYREFGDKADQYAGILSETARRFRYEKDTIRQIAAELKALPVELTEADFTAACRAELNIDIGELAVFIEPRFIDEELILPNKQAVQFDEQMAAMRTLTKVHYSWGTARAWNEGGITVLFAGPPGTGKTMAAEVMAHKLNLPMYKVDLSQVVNKYIGETEKNLKRIFDAAEVSDMVLFFDEADALFGKRTETNDSRDRYANLEVSYLLERMERFKGLAILATNRKSDFDSAFQRRIRYIIDFPMPDEIQREAIWRQVVPPNVARESAIDYGFLARRFPLSGGHIRSIVFNACLQSAAGTNGEKVLQMKDVLVAVKREYDKMNRSMSLEQLGQYAADIAALE